MARIHWTSIPPPVRVLIAAAVVTIGLWQSAWAASPAVVARVLQPGERLQDPRLGRQRSAVDKFHPWTPPATKQEWEKEARAVRERVLVATGLWPMPPREALNPVIHGKIDRGEYTVEKVFFASLPGHYVTGNLYRPKKLTGQVPGVLCPHGHWDGGRFNQASERKAKFELAAGAERTRAGARYFLQARMVELARLGCVVFHYDMVGYADSFPIRHEEGFTDAEASLRLQSFCGLQTFNSIRALDFLLSLPEVDPHRIGVTGASGGGTQTLLLCAADPRPTVSFPAVMVSTNMQGDENCENADYLRIGINNVALAAVFAPKPQAMSAAHDWTIDLETKGLPELKQVYGFYGAANKVDAHCFKQFRHNYNCVSREMMYNWFNRFLSLGHKPPIIEQDFEPIDPKDLSVFDAEHPRPRDARTAPELRKYLTEVARKLFAEIVPKDREGLARYREIVGTAARVMLATPPEADDINIDVSSQDDLSGSVTLFKGTATRADDKTQLPWVLLRPEKANGTVVLWLDGQGKSHLFGDDGKPKPAVRKLLDAGNSVTSVDLFLTGEFLEPGKPVPALKINRKNPGLTFAYNRPLVSNRVHDVLTAVAGLRKNEQARKIQLIGTGDAGPIALLAAAVLRGQVSDVIADARGLDYEKIPPANDPMFLPGALRYGGLGGLAALAAPTALEVFGTEGVPGDQLATLSNVYRAAGGHLVTRAGPLTAPRVVARLAQP